MARARSVIGATLVALAAGWVAFGFGVGAGYSYDYSAGMAAVALAAALLIGLALAGVFAGQAPGASQETPEETERGQP